MKSTMRLFGHPKSRYEPCLTELAEMRIADALEVKRELVKLRDVEGTDMKALIKRHGEVVAAIQWWTDLMEEED